MLQVIQNVRGGKPQVMESPAPLVQRGQVLIQNHYSVISAGTEKYVIELAGQSLLGKARERPDQVRQVLQKIRTAGLVETWSQVQERLNDSLSLGYSSTGVVLACGAGGTTVELVHDIAVRITPLTDLDATEMLRSLATFPLLDGYRGAPLADVGAVERLLKQSLDEEYAADRKLSSLAESSINRLATTRADDIEFDGMTEAAPRRDGFTSRRRQWSSQVAARRDAYRGAQIRTRSSPRPSRQRPRSGFR